MFPEDDTPTTPVPRPRTRLQGGFVMDRATTLAWASRIVNEQLLDDDITWAWEIIEDKVQCYGSRFLFVGEELNAEFMVVTQSAVFWKGHKGMDPSLIPQFKEGEQEMVARKLLEEEGLGPLVFATRLD
ncbi:hypothetical protein ARMGADRAFT_791489 [Armillaria gallica]|uniref:Uncharacterized protein n=1 Tax=Armillaria gallica TaxID=47427 RepID=A0A2H3DMZ7_ARMGA|nr:hypothetical protein ARMGADRAFT_791489 [Armillaria gallica]